MNTRCFARSNGVSFVDVTDPYNSVYLGNLPSVSGADVSHDVKTYGNYAYIVADGSVGPHGLQVFDLTALRNVTTPQTFSSTLVDHTFRSAHNIAINEESGYAYVVGSDLFGGQAVVYNLANPGSPEYVGGIAVDGYIHDTQVVNYHGPDPDHAGREIMFTASANDFVVIDVTDKAAPFRIWEDVYPNVGYVHQGWLSEDHSKFYLNDETDSHWTHKWDMTDLDNPVYLGSIAPSVGSSIDHNLYVKGQYIYEANYTSGLRVFEITDAETMAIQEVAWLDTYPTSNSGSYNGAWSVYPFFESGTIISSDISNGLFVSRVDLRPADFNADGYVDCEDIDQLIVAISSASTQPWFDLNGDSVVDLGDRDAWLVLAGNENIGAPYLVGDIDLDGFVDGSDFVIWNQSKFTANAAWCRGDINADGFVDGLDFIAWNKNKFQSSDRSALQQTAVPEPGTSLLLCCGMLAAAIRPKRRPV